MKVNKEDELETIKLGFLSLYSLDNDSTYRGGILITDESTKPLEFRVTAPIKPTPLQKTLYGDILKEHIMVELIGVPLINALKTKPEIILVRNSLFLGINEHLEYPAIRLFKDNEVSYSQDNRESEQLHSTSGKYEPIFFETSRNCEDKLPNIRKTLMDIFSTKNLMEPFERVFTAVKEVHEKNLVP